jgi:multidrug transporter EmrE-like cation transporter
MGGITAMTIVSVLAISVLQVAGAVILPKSQGFTNVPVALAIIAMYAVSLFIMARLIQGGASLSILIPFLSAVGPMLAMGAAIFFYGESASFAKIGMLVTACLLVGVASRA